MERREFMAGAAGVMAGHVALEKTAPMWHPAQLPTGVPVMVPSLTKMSRPRRSCGVRMPAAAAAFVWPPASRHRS